MDTVAKQHLRDAILQKKARIAEIERALTRPLPTGRWGQPISVSSGGRLRLEEERQHLMIAVTELERNDLLQKLSAGQDQTNADTSASTDGKPYEHAIASWKRRSESTQEMSLLQHDRWRDFHDRFMLLANEQQPFLREDRWLRVYCEYNSDRTATESKLISQGLVCLLYRFESGKWYVSEGPDENFKARFEALATRAGFELGSPKGTLPLNFWLHSLCRHLRRTDSQELFVRDDTGGIITNACRASATFCSLLEKRAIEISSSFLERDAKPTNKREEFVLPILDKKGWSILDWASNSKVDFHTANNYLKGKTKPYKSTRRKLAESLSVEAGQLPQ